MNSEIKNKIISFNLKENEYILSRLDDYSYYELWQNSLKIQNDYRFILGFYLSLKKEGQYLNLAQLYVTLKSLCGESGRFFDDWKGSFSFPFLLEIIRSGKTSFKYLLDIYDFRGSVEFSIRRCLQFDDDCPPGSGSLRDRDLIHQPFEEEFSRQEINEFIVLLYGYLIGYFEALETDYRELFFKKVDSNLILYGYKEGYFFEEDYDSPEEYEQAVKLL